MVCQILFYKITVVQNSTAHLVTRSQKHDHITPILYEPHLIPVQQCILYKVLMIPFKALHDLAPMLQT